MEKLVFETDEGPEEFYVLEQTRINSRNYLLVAESVEEDSEEEEVFIMREVEGSDDESSVYEFVDDEAELDAVFKVFEELLNDEE